MYTIYSAADELGLGSIPIVLVDDETVIIESGALMGRYYIWSILPLMNYFTAPIKKSA